MGKPQPDPIVIMCVDSSQDDMINVIFRMWSGTF